MAGSAGVVVSVVVVSVHPGNVKTINANVVANIVFMLLVLVDGIKEVRLNTITPE